ncbi:hypothetical protein ACJJTC_004622 [Scirpophaga incertulas]
MSPILSSAQEKIVPILHNSQNVKRSKRKKPENWIKNVRKNKRNIGETYTTNKGKIIQSKKCGTDDCSIDRQRDLIVSNVLSSEDDYWEEFNKVKLKERVTRSERNSDLAKLYSKQILIKPVKHTDLMAMCQDGTIPKNYHYFYKNLPAESVTGMNKSQQDGDYLELLVAGIAG